MLLIRESSHKVKCRFMWSRWKSSWLIVDWCSIFKSVIALNISHYNAIRTHTSLTVSTHLQFGWVRRLAVLGFPRPQFTLDIIIYLNTLFTNILSEVSLAHWPSWEISGTDPAMKRIKHQILYPLNLFLVPEQQLILYLEDYVGGIVF